MGTLKSLADRFTGSKKKQPRQTGAKRQDYKGKRGRLNLRLPVNLLEALDKACKDTGTTKTDFAQEALEKAIKRASRLK